MDSYTKREDGQPAAASETASADEDAGTPAARKRGSRAEEKARKRAEAEARNARKSVGKLEREVAKLESAIEALEATQKERSDQLADPDVYADKARSGELITAFKDGQAELEKLQGRWERALTELEAANAEQ